jgi:hypothetical protein
MTCQVGRQIACQEVEGVPMMVTVGLLVRREAKPGTEADVERFLEGGLALVNQEPDTNRVVRDQAGAFRRVPPA